MRALLRTRCVSVATVVVLTAGVALAVSGGHVQMSADRQDARAAGTAHIRGLVTAADSGAPLRGVRVTLKGGAPPRVVVATTDSSGRYEIEQLASGRYTLAFTKSGFVPLDYGQRHALESKRILEIADGQAVDKLDASLSRAGAIEGRILDEHGEPLAEVSVTASRFEMRNGQRRIVPAGRTVVTDDKGRYRLYGLDTGDYCVTASVQPSALPSGVRAPDGVDAPTFFPGTPNVDEASRVSLAGALDVVNIDFALKPVRLARISGIVVPSGAELLDGASVALVRTGIVGGVAGVSELGPGGQFVITGVPPGRYLLHARSIARTVMAEIARTGKSAPLSANREGQYGMLAITVTGDDLSSLSIVTAAGGVLSGRVMLGGQHYIPTKPVKVAVGAVPVGPLSMASGPSSLLLGSDGIFDIGGISGSFVVRMTGLPAPLTVSAVRVGGADVSDTGVIIAPGQELSNVEIELTSTPTRLSGRVQVGSAAGLGSTVIVFSRDEKRWSLPESRYLAASRTDGKGIYNVEGLPPGDYFITALSSHENGRELDPNYLRQLAGSDNVVRTVARKGETTTMNLQLAPR